jgi:hypothetical protein
MLGKQSPPMAGTADKLGKPPKILHADARTIIARCDGRLTISIGAAVDGILDDPVDGGVVWTPPSGLAILALHRQIEIVLAETGSSPRP